MILSHLLPTDKGECPFCKILLITTLPDQSSYCNQCNYHYYNNFFILIYTLRYIINISTYMPSLQIRDRTNEKNIFDFPQQEFISFDWKSSDIDSKLDLLLFYR